MDASITSTNKQSRHHYLSLSLSSSPTSGPIQYEIVVVHYAYDEIRELSNTKLSSCSYGSSNFNFNNTTIENRDNRCCIVTLGINIIYIAEHRLGLND